MLHSIGLGGDGDEVVAIQLVEKRLGLQLDYSDAARWRTLGDLHGSIIQVRPDLKGSRRAWRRMVVALCSETGINPRGAQPETLLLSDVTLVDSTKQLIRWLISRVKSHA
jgi:hypothetical protein